MERAFSLWKVEFNNKIHLTMNDATLPCLTAFWKPPFYTAQSSIRGIIWASGTGLAVRELCLRIMNWDPREKGQLLFMWLQFKRSPDGS